MSRKNGNAQSRAKFLCLFAVLMHKVSIMMLTTILMTPLKIVITITRLVRARLYAVQRSLDQSLRMTIEPGYQAGCRRIFFHLQLTFDSFPAVYKEK